MKKRRENQHPKLGLIIHLIKEGKKSHEIKEIIECKASDLKTAYIVVAKHRRYENRRLKDSINAWHKNENKKES